MAQRSQSIKLLLVVAMAAVFLATIYGRITSAAAIDSAPAADKYELPFGPNPFAPSNARTTTGGFIGQAEFIPAARCSGCHKTVHADWTESSHRNSFREPFYQTNVKHLIAERGIAVTRHCESCHNPVALFSGALSVKANIARPFDEEGVSCSVCHSIEATTLEGIGSYTIAPPALLERANGERIREATDKEILADLDSHRRAVMRPVLKTSEFCAACHKAAVLPQLNGRKWLRSFAIYDEWQQSAFSGQTVQPLSKRETLNCQTCHMQAATDGYAQHRWPGGNTAIAAYYKWPKQQAATTTLLQSGVITVDIFALRPRSQNSPTVIAPTETAATSIPVGETIDVDVVVANRGVGHSFPAELRDIFEAWLECEVTDATGRVLLHSGAVRADGTLEPEAHAYRAVPINDNGEPITRHDIWNTRTTALDRQIAAGRADLGRFSFAVPPDARSPISVTARLNYRRFNNHFNDWVARDFPVRPAPVVEMNDATVKLPVETQQTLKAAPAPEQDSTLRQRWRMYGVALFDQQQYEAATKAFEQALRLSRRDSADESSSQIDLAMALLRMERFGAPRAVFERAEQALARALDIDPTSGRARFLRALLNIKLFSYTAALSDLEALSRERPRDRQVWTQLATLYLLQRRDKEAQAAYERVLEVDPDDTGAHMKLAGLFWRFQLIDFAKREQDAYQARHTDTVAETLRRSYLRAHPELSSTWPWREFGDNPIGSIP